MEGQKRGGKSKRARSLSRGRPLLSVFSKIWIGLPDHNCFTRDCREARAQPEFPSLSRRNARCTSYLAANRESRCRFSCWPLVSLSFWKISLPLMNKTPCRSRELSTFCMCICGKGVRPGLWRGCAPGRCGSSRRSSRPRPRATAEPCPRRRRVRGARPTPSLGNPGLAGVGIHGNAFAGDARIFRISGRCSAARCS